jgi:hypothetical protein
MYLCRRLRYIYKVYTKKNILDLFIHLQTAFQKFLLPLKGRGGVNKTAIRGDDITFSGRGGGYVFSPEAENIFHT